MAIEISHRSYMPDVTIKDVNVLYIRGAEEEYGNKRGHAAPRPLLFSGFRSEGSSSARPGRDRRGFGQHTGRFLADYLEWAECTDYADFTSPPNPLSKRRGGTVSDAQLALGNSL